MSWVDSSKEIETEIYSTHGFRRVAIKTQQKSVKSQKRFEMHEQYESQCVFFGVFFYLFCDGRECITISNHNGSLSSLSNLSMVHAYPNYEN